MESGEKKKVEKEGGRKKRVSSLSLPILTPSMLFPAHFSSSLRRPLPSRLMPFDDVSETTRSDHVTRNA